MVILISNPESLHIHTYFQEFLTNQYADFFLFLVCRHLLNIYVKGTELVVFLISGF